MSYRLPYTQYLNSLHGKAIVHASMNLLTHQGQYKLQRLHQSFDQYTVNHLLILLAIYSQVVGGWQWAIYLEVVIWSVQTQVGDQRDRGDQQPAVNHWGIFWSVLDYIPIICNMHTLPGTCSSTTSFLLSVHMHAFKHFLQLSQLTTFVLTLIWHYLQK